MPHLMNERLYYIVQYVVHSIITVLAHLMYLTAFMSLRIQNIEGLIETLFY